MQGFDFQRDVIERSRETPVIVDFQASWCQPCRVLGPLLEELAAEADGRWVLVPIDTESHPEVADRYAIRSIPAVKMIHHGEVISEFVGALPRAEVVRWLEESLPDPGKEEVEALAAKWEALGPGLAKDLEPLVEADPDDARKRLRLAQAVVTADPARARSLIGGLLPPLDLVDLPDDVAALADFMESGDAPAERAAPHVAEAREALGRHDLPKALEELVEVVMRDREFADDGARRAAVALFHFLGAHHPLTEEWERRLSMVLLS